LEFNIELFDINKHGFGRHMDTEQARTFLALAAHGSFFEALRQLHLT
jgi:hypothetical protein